MTRTQSMIWAVIATRAGIYNYIYMNMNTDESGISISIDGSVNYVGI